MPSIKVPTWNLKAQPALQVSVTRLYPRGRQKSRPSGAATPPNESPIGKHNCQKYRSDNPIACFSTDLLCQKKDWKRTGARANWRTNTYNWMRATKRRRPTPELSWNLITLAPTRLPDQVRAPPEPASVATGQPPCPYSRVRVSLVKQQEAQRGCPYKQHFCRIWAGEDGRLRSPEEGESSKAARSAPGWRWIALRRCGRSR